jgi:hypothetical protein
MTMPCERTRSVVQTRDFLEELSHDESLPERVRRDARFLLRHYPTKHDMLLAGIIEEGEDTALIGTLSPVFSSSFSE